MAASVTATGTEAGHYIVGELLGIELPRSFTRREKNPDGSDSMGLTRPKVRLLVGTRVEVIPFKSLPELRAAIGEPAERELVACPVWINGPYDEATNRSLPSNASFSGRAPRDFEADSK